MRLLIKRHRLFPAAWEFESKNEMYRFWAFVAGLSFPGYHIGLNTLITTVVGSNSIDTVLAYGILISAFVRAFVSMSSKKWYYYLKPLLVIFAVSIVAFFMAKYIYSVPTYIVNKMRTTFFQTAFWGALAFNMIDDKKLIKKAFRVVGYVVFFFLVYEPFSANSTLFIEMSNNSWGTSGYLTWGYRMLVAAVLLIYSAFETKRRVDGVCAIIASIEVVMIGSRGSAVALAVFLILYILFCTKADKRVKYVFLFGGMALIVISQLNFSNVVKIQEFLARIGVSSRNLTKLLNDSLTESGREAGYSIAMDQILSGNNWFGLGVGGDQALVGNYPHNILLEVLLQYGNAFGGILFIVLVYKTIRCFLICRDLEWKGIFVACFSIAMIKLLFSSTYWFELWFWAYLVAIYKINKKSRNKNEY